MMTTRANTTLYTLANHATVTHGGIFTMGPPSSAVPKSVMDGAIADMQAAVQHANMCKDSHSKGTVGAGPTTLQHQQAWLARLCLCTLTSAIAYNQAHYAFV